MADPLAVTLHASGAETTTGAATGVDIKAIRRSARLTLDVTSVSGTSPELTVSVETSPTGAGNWKSVGAFSKLSAAGYQHLTVANLEQFVRASWVIAGTDTPTFTFSVAGNAHVLYADPIDLDRYSINATALLNVSAAAKADALLRATDDAESALNSAYSMPITAWGEDLRGMVADRAAYYAMTHRGFNPANEADQLILLKGGHVTVEGRKTAAEMFFSDVAAGKRKPVGIVDQTPATYEASGVVVSDPARGW